MSSEATALVRICNGCGAVTAADVDGTPERFSEMAMPGQRVKWVTPEICRSWWGSKTPCKCQPAAKSSNQMPEHPTLAMLDAGWGICGEGGKPDESKMADAFRRYSDLRIAVTGRKTESNQVNHPSHYNAHPSGVECITVAEHFGFNLGNVIKYVWRAEEKGAPIEDLKKAAWYLNREIERREKL